MRLSDIDTDAVVVILHIIRLQILFLLFLKVGEGKSVGKIYSAVSFIGPIQICV